MFCELLLNGVSAHTTVYENACSVQVHIATNNQQYRYSLVFCSTAVTYTLRNYQFLSHISKISPQHIS